MALPYNQTFAAVEPARESSDRTVEINDIEKYIITWSLPLNRRVGHLWGAEPRMNDFAIKCIVLSLARTVNREVIALIKSNTAIPEKLSASKTNDIHACIATHLPTLAVILDHPAVANSHLGQSSGVNSGVTIVLKYAVASSIPLHWRDRSSRYRSRFRDLLRLRITHFWEAVGSSSTHIASFFHSAHEILKTEIDAAHTSIESVIIQQTAILVKQREHAARNGIRDANDVVRRTFGTNAKEWNERVSGTKLKADGIWEDETAARGFMGRMTLKEEEEQVDATLGAVELLNQG
jgi:hypothetical protein